MKRNSNIVTFKGTPVTLMGKLVKTGSQAKNFTAVRPDFEPFRFSEFSGKVRIISSVPSIDTSICAQQARRFNVEAAQIENLKVINISCDLPTALGRFCATEGINSISVVSDHHNTDFGVKYGLLIEEYRLLARSIVVVDKDDIVQYVEVVGEIASHPDYDKALNVANSLLGRA